VCRLARSLAIRKLSRLKVSVSKMLEMNALPEIERARLLQRLRDRKNHLEESLSSYDVVDKELVELPKTLKKDVMVPLGPLAFVPGTVRQTNEVMVLLGENQFVLRSCFQAREIIQRRRSKLNEELKQMEARIETHEAVSETVKEKSKAEEPIHIRESLEESAKTLSGAVEKEKFKPISKEEHMKIMSRLDNLEKLEALSEEGMKGRQKPTEQSSKDSEQQESNAPKKKMSLFKQRRMQQRQSQQKD